MRNWGVMFLSLVLTTVVIGNAYYQKKQFYPSVVYITKSNPSMAVSKILRKFSVAKLFIAYNMYSENVINVTKLTLFVINFIHFLTDYLHQCCDNCYFYYYRDAKKKNKINHYFEK